MRDLLQAVAYGLTVCAAMGIFLIIVFAIALAIVWPLGWLLG